MPLFVTPATMADAITSFADADACRAPFFAASFS